MKKKELHMAGQEVEGLAQRALNWEARIYVYCMGKERFMRSCPFTILNGSWKSVEHPEHRQEQHGGRQSFHDAQANGTMFNRA
jgi:hypothetical protein